MTAPTNIIPLQTTILRVFFLFTNMVLSYAFTFTSILPFNPFAPVTAETPPNQHFSSYSNQNHWPTQNFTEPFEEPDFPDAISFNRPRRPRLPKPPRRDLSHLDTREPEPLQRKRGWEPSMASASTSTSDRRATGEFEFLPSSGTRDYRTTENEAMADEDEGE